MSDFQADRYDDTPEASARYFEERKRKKERARQYLEPHKTPPSQSLDRSVNPETTDMTLVRGEMEFLEIAKQSLIKARQAGHQLCLEFDATADVSLPTLTTTSYIPTLHSDFKDLLRR
jgi:hypothetical protein